MDSTLRRTWAEIDLDALRYNYHKIKEKIGSNVKFLGVVKADAYGHGSQMIAQTMLASGVDMFGVSSVDEGLDLRNVKIKAPILVVGAIPVWAVETAAKNDIAFSVFNDDHLAACKEVYERSTFFGLMMKDYKNVLCISGTHGKSTTSGMVSTIFMEAIVS